MEHFKISLASAVYMKIIPNCRKMMYDDKSRTLNSLLGKVWETTVKFYNEGG